MSRTLLNISFNFTKRRWLICLIFVSFILTMPLVSQSSASSEGQLYQINHDVFLENIAVSKWKKGAPACLNISFDDNLSKWKQMSEIIESYGLRGTFFPIAKTWNIYKDSLLIMSAKGHEMGSHSFSHPNLKELAIDTSQIIFELEKSKEMVEDLFGKKCHVFAEPFNGRSNLSIGLIEKYYSFVRNNSFSPNSKDLLLPYSTLTSDKLIKAIEDGMKQGTFIRLYGHSIDGEGSGPIPKDFFVESLKTLQNYSNTKGLWITSLAEGSLYQKVNQEVRLVKSLAHDTLTINIEMFNDENYVDFDEVPLSIQIPKYYCEDIEVLYDSIEVTENNLHRILTFDLLTTKKLTVLMKNVITIQSNNSICVNDLVKVYPNPAVDYLNFDLSDGGIILSKKIYGLDGKLILSNFDNNNYLSLKSIAPGCYIIETDAIIDSSECRAKSIIIKK